MCPPECQTDRVQRQAFVSVPFTHPSFRQRQGRSTFKTSPPATRRLLAKHPRVAPASLRATPRAVAYEDDDGRRVLPVPLFISATEGQAVKGVYAVVQLVGGETEFVSLSRDVRASLMHILSTLDDEDDDDDDYDDDDGGADLGAQFGVRIMTFHSAVPDLMVRVADDWITECDEVPRGNAVGWPEFDADLVARAGWSTVWRGRSGGDIKSMEAAGIVSPFAAGETGRTTIERGQNGGTVGEGGGNDGAAAEILELNAENVDTVLEEVRPFLLADGGNIRVVGVDAAAGTVDVALVGACGGCASAGTTMREGVEKVLRKRFGDALREVKAIQLGDGGGDGFDPGDSGIVSQAACERALEPIRGVLHGLGADVQIVEVDEDEVVINYTGPNNLRLGVETQLLERVAGLEVVTFEDNR